MKNKTKHSSTYDCLLRDQTSPLCSFAGCRQVAWGAAAFTPSSPQGWAEPAPHQPPVAPRHRGWLLALCSWWRKAPCWGHTPHGGGFFVWLVVFALLGCLVLVFSIFKLTSVRVQVKVEWKGRRKNKRSLKLTIKPTTSNISAIHLSSNLSLLPF